MTPGPVARFSYRGIGISLEGVAMDDLIFDAITSRGTFYEDDLLEYMRAVLGSHNACIVDVGANIGNHSVYFGRFLADSVIAVEANPRVVPTLRRNLERNKVCHRIFETGVGAKPGYAVIELSAKHRSNVGAARLRLDGTGNSPATDRVAVTTLDALRGEIESVSRNGRIDAMKLDVEGMEPAVLRGAAGILADHAPELFIEAMNDENLRDIDALLRPLGYRRLVAHASTPVWHFAHRRNISPHRLLHIATYLLTVLLVRLYRRFERKLRRWRCTS